MTARDLLSQLHGLEGVAPPTSEELVQQVASGDEAAFGQLYEILAGPIYGVVLRVLRDPAQSEEVAQEVSWSSSGAPRRGTPRTRAP